MRKKIYRDLEILPDKCQIHNREIKFSCFIDIEQKKFSFFYYYYYSLHLIYFSFIIPFIFLSIFYFFLSILFHDLLFPILRFIIKFPPRLVFNFFFVQVSFSIFFSHSEFFFSHIYLN